MTAQAFCLTMSHAAFCMHGKIQPMQVCASMHACARPADPMQHAHDKEVDKFQNALTTVPFISTSTRYFIVKVSCSTCSSTLIMATHAMAMSHETPISHQHIVGAHEAPRDGHVSAYS